MNKVWVLCIGLWVMTGCSSYQGATFKDYMEHPSLLVKDPHYGEYQKERNELERKYLYDEVSYTDYMTQREELDNRYSQEVQNREKIFSANDQEQ